jgi:hypothetical protein
MGAHRSEAHHSCAGQPHPHVEVELARYPRKVGDPADVRLDREPKLSATID